MCAFHKEYMYSTFMHLKEICYFILVQKLSSKVTLTHDNLPDNVRVEYSPRCDHPIQEGANKGVCDKVTVNKEVSVLGYFNTF